MPAHTPNRVKLLLLIALAAFAAASIGCRSRGQTGALAGAGIGALAGQAIGGDTGSTLIGSGVGAGLGYIVGNEMDKSERRDRETRPAPRNTTRRTLDADYNPLAGTRWRVVEMTPSAPMDDALSKVLEFGGQGELTTITTFKDGAVEVDRERYQVTDSTLVLRPPGRTVRASYEKRGGRLTIEAPDLRIVATRLN